MSSLEDRQISALIRALDNEDRQVRIQAIHQLGNTGDELCLKELRERLQHITPEQKALIIAVGKLKKSLGIK
jgi:HEAT repeat protein